MNIPVFDLHCDTSCALLGTNLRQCGSLLENNYHIDLKRAASLPGYAQVFSCYCSTECPEVKLIPPTELFEREMVSVLREVEVHKDKIELCYDADRIEHNLNNKMMSAILSIEGPAGFGFDPELLEDLYNIGFRITTLCWNEKNPLTGSHLTGGGLTEQGRAYVRESQRLGMIVDVSHISDEGFWDVMDMTQAPVIASHSNSRSVHAHSRNLTDEMFKEICKTGGVAGLNVFKTFVGGAEDLDALCDHTLHWLSIDENGEHIALGGDLDGCDTLVDGFDGVQSYPVFAETMLQRGIPESIIERIFWKNALGVIRHCCM